MGALITKLLHQTIYGWLWWEINLLIIDWFEEINKAHNVLPIQGRLVINKLKINICMNSVGWCVNWNEIRWNKWNNMLEIHLSW